MTTKSSEACRIDKWSFLGFDHKNRLITLYSGPVPYNFLRSLFPKSSQVRFVAFYANIKGGGGKWLTT